MLECKYTMQESFKKEFRAIERGGGGGAGGWARRGQKDLKAIGVLLLRPILQESTRRPDSL